MGYKKKSGSSSKTLSMADTASKKVEKKGEEVKVEPAIVEEASIKVRGTAVGGVKMMTRSEYDTYCTKK